MFWASSYQWGTGPLALEFDSWVLLNYLSSSPTPQLHLTSIQKTRLLFHTHSPFLIFDFAHSISESVHRERSGPDDNLIYTCTYMVNFTLKRLTLSTLAKKRKSLSRSNLVSAVKITHINRLAMDNMSGYMIWIIVISVDQSRISINQISLNRSGRSVTKKVGHSWISLIKKAGSSLIDVGYCRVESFLVFQWLDLSINLCLKTGVPLGKLVCWHT